MRRLAAPSQLCGDESPQGAGTIAFDKVRACLPSLSLPCMLLCILSPPDTFQIAYPRVLGGYPDGSHSVRAWPLCEPLRLLSSPQSGAFDGHDLVSTALCACARALSNKYCVNALCWLCSRLVATSGTHVCRSVWDLRVEPKLQSIPTNVSYISNAMYKKNHYSRSRYTTISLYAEKTQTS